MATPSARGAVVLPPLGVPFDGLAGALVTLCNDAAAAIAEVYERGFEITTKDDRSPVTQADLAAHHVLCDGLAALTPEIPVLSEESAAIPWQIRQRWRRFWLVDPLDGTKEFIKRNGEFSVNVALVEDGTPILGIVQEPVTGRWHLGLAAQAAGGAISLSDEGRTTGHSAGAVAGVAGVWTGVGGWREGALRPPGPAQRPAGRLRVAVSRSHRTENGEPLLAAWPTTERVALGSSLKYTRMVDGELDAYPRLGPTCGWDTAAAHVVLAAAGGCIVDASGAPLRYNTRASVRNPCFLALADRSQLGALLPDFQRAAHSPWLD